MSAPAIPPDELRFAYSRSSGPGGQNVNRVETRVTLLFDVLGSPSLTEEQKLRLRARLGTRINKDGVLRVVAQRHRTREGNRRAALERFDELLAQALKTLPPRRATRAPAGSKRRRIDTKRQRGAIKRARSRPEGWDD